MAASKKDQSTQSRSSQKSTGQDPTRSRSGSKTSSSATQRAQAKTADSPRAATKSMTLPSKARSAARSTTTSTTRKSSGDTGYAGRSPASRRTRSQGGSSGAQNWLSSIETMVTTREGREIIAEALRAVATVLDRRNQRDQEGSVPGSRQERPLGGRRRSEATGQDMRTGAPVTNPAAEMVAGALGVAQAATDVVTDTATGVMLGGLGAAGAEDEGRQGTSKRRSSRKRTSENT